MLEKVRNARKNSQSLILLFTRRLYGPEFSCKARIFSCWISVKLHWSFSYFEFEIGLIRLDLVF